MIAEIDAGATSPVLKVPPDLRATLDSNPGLQASFDDGARSSERGAGVLRNPGATESPWDSNSELRRLETNVVSRPDSLGGEHAETNPMAMPIQAMAAHRSTAPMPIPEHTKIGVVERPMIAPTIAPVPPRGKPITTPPSNSAAIAMLDAARVRQIPDRVAHVTPTAMNVAIPEGPGASLRDSGFDHDDDNYHETQERRIDREALRKLPGAAQVIALAVPPVVLDPPSAPAVLTGPPQHSSEPRIEPARPTAPRGGLVWLWMVLAALAIAAAVATAMWYLAS
jgi:hypothetical protein